ncbi:MAG TPA: VWA domain-containing protein [Pyrinomonadaceae bacterium]|jgi:VWFA-related protein
MKACSRISPGIPLRLLFLLLAVACCYPSTVWAQAKGEEGDETIRVDTGLVDLNVSVFNHDPQRAVGQLVQKDFVVLEDGQPQEVVFFASASTPFDLVLLLDLSGSTSDKLDLIRRSARRFVEAARPTDRIGIVTFTDEPSLISPLTSDREELFKRIKKIKKPDGGTRFWDALRYVLEIVLRESNGSHRSAVVVMTDGVDNNLPGVLGNGSETRFEYLLEMVKQSESIVLPIYLDTEREMVEKQRATEITYIIAREQLAQLAEESGSLVYEARRVEDLNGVYEQVIRDLGTVYSLGYRPSNKLRDGKWRTVAVRLVARPDLATRTKRGYYAN